MNLKSITRNPKSFTGAEFVIRHSSFAPLLLCLLLATSGHAASRVVRVQDMTVAPGQTNRLLLVLESLGDENAFGVNLAYNTNLLTFVRAVRSTDSTNMNATLNVNANQTTNFGRLGLACGLEISTEGFTYPAGTNLIAEIYFTPAAGVTSATAAITFTNLPIVPQVSDLDASPIPATFVGGNVFIHAPCTFVLNTNAAAFAQGGGSGAVNLTSVFGCDWTVSNTNSWITFTAATNGTTSAVVNYTVASNPNPGLRTGVFSVAGLDVTVTQQGISCSYSLSAAGGAHSPAAETNAVSVTTSNLCPWSVSNTNGWVSILAGSNGTGSGPVTYAVAANQSVVARTGAVVIAGQVFSVTQQGVACTYALAPANRTHSAAVETNTASVTTSNGCAWSAVNTNPWVTILTGGSGAGNGVVTYSVATNLSVSARTGTVVIAGQTFTVTQQGVVCAYALAPASRTHAAAAVTNTVSVTTGGPCPWSVSNTNAWITLLAGSNGPGSGPVTYALSANQSLSERIGALVVGGQTFIVTQQAVVCAFTLSLSNRTHTAAATTNNFLVNVSSPCPWTVVNTNPWITILSGGSGAGNGTVTYALTANSISLDRTGTLVIDSQVFTVTQQGIACSFTVAPTKRTHGFGATANFFTVNTATGCLWSVVNTNPWITISSNASGFGTNNVGYAVSDNNTLLERIGYLNVQGATMLITQRATTCTYTLSQTNRALGFLADTGTNSVTAGAGCAWTAATTNNWISITGGASGSGNGSFTYAVLTNFSRAARTGTVTVASQIFTLTQSAYSGGFSFRPVTVAANGNLNFTILGGPAGIWELQSSPDLAAWTKVADLTNTAGRVDFSAPILANTNRFFRAVLP